jgi:hypothetical protein
MVASWWGSRKNKDLIFWFITDPYSEIFVHLAYKDNAQRESAKLPFVHFALGVLAFSAYYL